MFHVKHGAKRKIFLTISPKRIALLLISWYNIIINYSPNLPVCVAGRGAISINLHRFHPKK